MGLLKKILDFYISSSIHVALSVCSFVLMTHYIFKISDGIPMICFVFFGTIAAYNFVKYDALARTQKLQMKSQLKAIAVLSSFSLMACGYFFFLLELITQLIAVGFLVLTLLYTLPFFPNTRNARNWAGIKIYIVALCWVGVTLILPIVNDGMLINMDVFLVAVQRFILVFVLILIFEIIDLQNDDPHLQTVPQQIGVKRTKILGSVLMLVFLGLEFVEGHFYYSLFLVKVGIALTVFLFLFFSNEKRSQYYTSFWAESIPIVWLILLFIIT